MEADPVATRRPLSPERNEKIQASREEAEYDAVLVRRFNEGDEKAFIEIVGRHRERIFSVALSLLKNKADADEITQDTFIRAYRGLSRFRGDSSLATWLHRIAVNLSRNRYWYFFRRRRHATLSVDVPLAEDSDATFADLISSPEQSPDHRLAIDEFSSIVEACMDDLSFSHREILVMCNQEHRTYDEISEALCIELGTVKSRIARARNVLRALIAQACPELRDNKEIIKMLTGSRERNTSSLKLA